MQESELNLFDLLRHNRSMDFPATVPTTPLLKAKSLTKMYGSRAALAGVDLHLHRETSLAIIGPSGAGKSTLLLTLGGVIVPDHGTVHFEDRNLFKMPEVRRAKLRREHFGYVFQNPQLVMELSALDNVALPLLVSGENRSSARERAEDALAKVGFDADLMQRCYYLSSGQAQLVSIARALVGRPEVIFADEPGGALDQSMGQEVMQLLSITARTLNAALLVVTHDANVASWCDRIVEMRNGLIHASGRIALKETEEDQ